MGEDSLMDILSFIDVGSYWDSYLKSQSRSNQTNFMDPNAAWTLISGKVLLDK